MSAQFTVFTTVPQTMMQHTRHSRGQAPPTHPGRFVAGIDEEAAVAGVQPVKG